MILEYNPALDTPRRRHAILPTEPMYTPTLPPNIACPVLRYGYPLHAHSATSRSCQRGMGLPLKRGRCGRCGRSVAGLNPQNCHRPQSWTAYRLALAVAGVADVAGILENFSATKAADSPKVIQTNSTWTSRRTLSRPSCLSVLPQSQDTSRRHVDNQTLALRSKLNPL